MDGWPTSFAEALECWQERSRPLPPWVFLAYRRLLDAMSGGDVERVVQILSAVDALARAPEPSNAEGLMRLGDCGWWQRLGAGRERPPLPLSGEIHAREEEVLCVVFNTLRRQAPLLYEELEVLVPQIALCEGLGFNGRVDPDCFGLVLLSRPKAHHDAPNYYLEHLIHAGAQLYWLCLAHEGTLVREEAGPPIESPWNRRACTPGDLLFELFWLARASRVFETLAAGTSGRATRDKAAVLRAGLEQLRSAGRAKLPPRLTDRGRELLETLGGREPRAQADRAPVS